MTNSSEGVIHVKEIELSIRNFIYLDTEKLRSVSSQLFEGITDYVVSSQSDSVEEQTTQHGPRSSGRILADIFKKENSSSELKFLSDHAFHILESRLESDGLLKSLEEVSSSKLSNCFLKVKGNIFLNDMKKSTYILRNFNDIGLALWRIQNDAMNAGGMVSTDKDARKGAQESELQLNEKVANAAAFITEFGFGDLLEVFMKVEDVELSAPLRRDFLREDENLFIQKYTRHPSFPFTLLGLVSRCPSQDSTSDLPDVESAPDPKAAMRYLAMHMANIEVEYSSKGENEFVIDPIAIYSEVTS